ncbi:MAG: hypothetical protein NC253_12930 [Ruminococcus sp.]|nr:hypothetical protein [Ruminococcus sp.]MCM1381665.1 hypothetical protein [Muribaculaceae bacterium]MCM1479896.1 hypothetical protein [Muribaculaceae bacterium]
MNISSANVTPVSTGFDPAGKKIVTVGEISAENGFKEAMNSISDDGVKTVTIEQLKKESGCTETREHIYVGRDGKEIDLDSLGIIALPPEWLKQWSSETSDKLIAFGEEYAKSCFDFSNSRDYAALTAAEDFTGMSPAEIYKAIYEKYRHCYGENFYYAGAVDYPMQPSDYDDYNRIIRRFENEVSAACGNAEQARRQALYGEKSGSEVRREIIGGYNLEDGMTFRELYQMTYDMQKAGVDGGLHNRLDLLFYDMDGGANSHMLTREQYLDTKVGGKQLSTLRDIYANQAMRGGVLPEYAAALGQISAACGAGGFSVQSVQAAKSADNNFQWIKL